MTTPKARLNQLYSASDGQPRYFTLSGRPPGCPAPKLQSGSTFYCKVELPNGAVVVSEPCRRKKDAEQDAARKALHEIGTPFESVAAAFSTMKSSEEVWIELKLRIETAFSNECVLNYKPLMEHFRAAIVRRGKSHAPVPATVLASLDTKIISMCKALDNISDGNPARALELVYKAAKGSSVLACDANMWISRVEPFPAHVKSGLLEQTTEASVASEKIHFDAVYIPFALDRTVSAIRINIDPSDYYMDVLARQLGIDDGARVLISRSITKAPSGTRLFWRLAERDDKSSGVNMRASTLTSHSVYGNAILAAVGSTWKSEGRLCYDDVSLGCYYRLALGKSPSGSYKLSRGALLTAELPPTFTSKSRWRGSTPRSLLNEFCHQSHLLAPTFCSYPVKGDSNDSCAGYEDHGCTADTSDQTDQAENNGNVNAAQGPFLCKLRMLVCGAPREFESERSYRNRNDAIQSACLQALLYFDTSLAHLMSSLNQSSGEDETSKQALFEVTEGEEKTCDRPPIGSMVHVEYSARLCVGAVAINVEKQSDFEFELGSGAVLGLLDTCVTGMCVGQSARFSTPLPSVDLLLATEKVDAALFHDVLPGSLSLEYTVSLLKYVEAAEARMESAVFSPPLSRQRIDFALELFQRSQALSLIDFGCGSGSFLEAIVEQPNSLQHIVGVDISLRSLTRASKSLQGKLAKLRGALESVTLYEGSIVEPDHRLHHFDVATCLEVVEHMDPEPLSRFGKSILGIMQPKVLLVSTPNIEYNPILHGIVTRKEKSEGLEETLDAKKAEGDETVRLRNDDHRFEWTRAEFSDWASDLACTYGYSVEFSGVGGTPGQEPGFASQMAIFTRMGTGMGVRDSEQPKTGEYSTLWRWSSKRSILIASARLDQCPIEIHEFDTEGFRVSVGDKRGNRWCLTMD
ncbi:small RNA 2'-O-methyltransferase isoform X2 [Selaginella moellendorffii]|uniref:small RNA 2'-O-methyltransferase isoform X2 n=1 Tax=Selaginella moellendorffii TaxID=88036 RepID=UPI000D1C7152|nr:small RNA 2'-O-methyltransferase isoform X2 [Selaginella moellendorffii]|eukprot:XP_024545577.1 small RNA 2'-O-methyltransferase isoform X2 [Selaginella moellendorffii]